MALSVAKKRKLRDKYNPVNLILVDAVNYDNWFENEEWADSTRKIDEENLTCEHYKVMKKNLTCHHEKGMKK